MSVSQEFATDGKTNVETAGNRVIEGCNSLLVAYTRDGFKVRVGLPTENKDTISLAGVEIIILESCFIRVTATIGGHATFGRLISGRLPECRFGAIDMAVLYVCGFSGDLPVIPCCDENISHFERWNAYPFKFTRNSTGCSGVVVDCGSSYTFRRQSDFLIYGSGVRIVASDTMNLIDGITGGLQTVIGECIE